MRPEFTNDGPLVIKQGSFDFIMVFTRDIGRHPIQEKLFSESFVPVWLN